MEIKMFIYVVVHTNNKGKIRLLKAFYIRSSAESYIFSLENSGKLGSFDIKEVPLVEQNFI